MILHSSKCLEAFKCKFEIDFNEMAKLNYLILIVMLSTFWLYLLHFFAPSLNENDNLKTQLKFPNSLEELRKVAEILKLYSVNHWWYVLTIFGSAFIYKQAFCIPGSLFLNILAGVLYGKFGGLFFACLFTAIGASFCYLLSYSFAKNLVLKYFLKRFSDFQSKVEASKNNLIYFMLFIRLIPVAPGWLINVTAPLVGIPLHTFILTTFFGLGPYNFIGVSAGEMLFSLKSVDDIFTWNVFFTLTMMAIIVGGPTYLLRIKSQNKIKVT